EVARQPTLHHSLRLDLADYFAGAAFFPLALITKIAAITVITNAKKNTIAAGIKPSIDSSKLTRPLVMDGRARQTMKPIPPRIIPSIPIINPAIFILPPPVQLDLR